MGIQEHQLLSTTEFDSLINVENQIQFTDHLQFHYLWLDAKNIDLNIPKQ